MLSAITTRLSGRKRKTRFRLWRRDQWVVFLKDDENPAYMLDGFEFIHNIVSRNTTANDTILFKNAHGSSIPNSTVEYNLFYNQGMTEKAGAFHGDSYITGDPKWESEAVWVGNKTICLAHAR